MSDWDNLVELTRDALETLLWEGDAMADRIEELEALYAAAKHDAQEAEAYAEALEAKLAKAVETISLCRKMQAQFAHPEDPLMVLLDTTIAELKGPSQ